MQKFHRLLFNLFIQFISFDALVNKLFLISFLECSWLLYRNIKHFCILILYLETLLKYFINSGVFHGFLRIFYIQNHHLRIEDSHFQSRCLPAFVPSFLRSFLPSFPSFCQIGIWDENSFNCLFPTCMLFTSVSCLIAWLEYAVRY